MELADARGAIAGAAKGLRHRELGFGEEYAVVEHPVRERRAPGEYRRAARHAHGVGGVVAGVEVAARGEGVDIGRARVLVARAAEAVAALLVGVEDDDVLALSIFCQVYLLLAARPAGVQGRFYPAVCARQGHSALTPLALCRIIALTLA